MKVPVRIIWGIILLLAGCSETKDASQPALFKFNELIDTQIDLLSQKKYTLEKSAAVDTSHFFNTFVPTPDNWRSELDIFRQLEMVNRPIYRNGYQSSGPLKDTRSNLKIHQYSSNSSPVILFRVYYQDQISKLKKIEATLAESNFLYSSRKALTLEFEEVDGMQLLTTYSIDGFQKVALRDTVTFRMRAQIDF